MSVDLVQTWLYKTIRAALAWNLVAMAGCVLGGLVILYVSFWVTYGVIWFVSHGFYPLRHDTILLITAAFMTLVVIVGARQNWEDLDPLQRGVRLAKDMDITLTPYTRYGMSYNTNAVKAGAFEVRSMASVINYVLCGGVKLLLGSVGKLCEVRRLKAVDVAGCARILLLLQMAPGRHSFEDIVGKLPGLNPVKAFEDLRHVDGVVFLSSEPAGLTLLPELREELGRL